MSDTQSAKSLFDKSRRPFLLRKIHSLTGVLPVGGFLVFHLWENSKALQGQERFDAAVADIGHMGGYYLIFLEAGILLPLFFHAFYGIKLALEAKPNVGHYTFSRNWMYTLQRITGVIAFAFIAYHLYEYWGQKTFGKASPDQFYPMLCANMSSTWHQIPVIALIYIIGIAASTFHFANGLWGFCFSWGITVSRRSQRAAATVFGLVGVVVFLLGANTAIYFATDSIFPTSVLPSFFAGSAKEGGASRTCQDVARASASNEGRGAPH